MDEQILHRHPSLAAWWYLARAYHSLAHELTRFLDRWGLTGPQFGVLRCVGEAGEEGLPLGELSERLMVTCGNITGVVDRLEQNGYLRRARSEMDRRVVYAQLTQEGWELYRRLLPAYRRRVGELLAAMEEEEQRQLAQLCCRVHHLVENQRSTRSETS